MELTDIFVLVVGLFSLLTNGILLLILLKDPLKCFQASSTYFIISLSVADLITGGNACFWAIDDMISLSPNIRRYLHSLFWITIQASFLTLMAMSVERFLIVKYPFYCRAWITKTRVSLFIAFIWLISTVLGGLVLLPQPQRLYVQFSIFTEFFISVFIIAGLYTFILLGIKRSQEALKGTGQLHQGGSFRGQIIGDLKVRRASLWRRSIYRANVANGDEVNEMRNYKDRRLFHKRSLPRSIRQPEDRSSTLSPMDTSKETGRIKEENNSECGKNGNENVEDSGSLLSCKTKRPLNRFAKVTQSIIRRERSRKIEHEKKLTAVVLLLVGVLALTVLPYLLASQIYVGFIIFSPCPAPPDLVKFTSIYFPIELLNFAVNPLIYAWRLPQYRRTLKYLCTRHRTPRSPSSANFVGTASANE